MRNIALTVVLLALTACTPWATYPPIEGAASIDDPQLAPIPDLMASAIAYGHEHYGFEDNPDDEIVFNLPPTTSPRVWEIVEGKLGNARPMTNDDVNAYHVSAVRVRTVDAEVDLICPRADGHAELVEIKFKQRLATGYHVTEARRWRVRVEVPEPTFVPWPRDVPDEAVATEPTNGEQ